jgi:hypothetical protein
MIIALRVELKSLREANKALTLYVSKIVDRVCSQEGFEKVLAVDFKSSWREFPSKVATNLSAPSVGHESTKTLSNPSNGSGSTPPPVVSQSKAASRPLSLDWRSVSSVFSSALSRSSPPPPPPPQPNGFKPLLLAEATTLAPRQLPTDEDEDDVRERERLRAEMALHGIVTSASGWGRPSIERGLSFSSNSSRLSISVRGTSPNLLSASPRDGGETSRPRTPRSPHHLAPSPDMSSSGSPELNFRRPSAADSRSRRSVSPRIRDEEDTANLPAQSRSHSSLGLGIGFDDREDDAGPPPL